MEHFIFCPIAKDCKAKITEIRVRSRTPDIYHMGVESRMDFFVTIVNAC